MICEPEGRLYQTAREYSVVPNDMPILALMLTVKFFYMYGYGKYLFLYMVSINNEL